MTMTLDKAIKILDRTEIQLRTAQDHDLFDAIKLGIEALKAIKEERTYTFGLVPDLLPGETRESDHVSLH